MAEVVNLIFFDSIMNEFNTFLHTLADSEYSIERKTRMLQMVIEDIQSYGIGSDENIRGHLKTITDIINKYNEEK